ncbi:unnamed protein product [Phaedon cochleariae]|uniref:PWWP domain-containing protein n=1 Tax=Phaedon cochleariae TaxID=80249 RepID=A0A9N9WYH3_PHACE|nr:unnamed protein product [Phaedon cochleariae]
MSEESESEYKYKDKDIVWVKLGPSWWPGEVKDLDSLPKEDFKKIPLVIVKFFDEDSYEYVKSWSSIYPYNCERKNDFIKKGMAGFRSKHPHMEKFPKDVTTAEEKTGGNPNILSDPIFIPEKRTNIVAEIFGTPSPKGKGLKDKKQRHSMKNSSRDTAYITHRRFLGADDYKAYICIQYPGKDRTFNDSEDEEVIRINNEPEQEFTCHSCSFTTKRLEVLVLHTKSHIQGDYVPGPRRPKRPVAIRKKREKTRKSHVGDATTETDSNSSDNDVLQPPKQKKRKTKSSATRKSSNAEKDKSARKSDVLSDSREENEPKKKTDIRSDLLAEWGLSEDEMCTTNEDSIQHGVTEDDSRLAESLDDTGREESSAVFDETMNEVSSQEEDAKETVEAEDDVIIEEETVIVEEDIVTIEDDVIEPEAKKTEKPKMDKETQEAIKSCFDFDEDEEDEHAIIINTVAASGRKIPRVIPPTERRRSDDDLFAQEEELPAFDKEEILKVSESFNRRSEGISKEIDATFKELMEETVVPQLPEVRNTLKCEQNFHCVKTIKFPDKPEEIGSSPKRKKSEVPDDKSENDRTSSVDKNQPETPIKLINPKKRFAKSFEDFEKEIEQKEVRKHKKYVRGSKTKTDSGIEKESQLESTSSQLPEDEHTNSEIELKTKILSRIVAEANINEESKIKIMSKMQKEQRTPRNKILESYLNDKSNEVVEISDHETVEEKNNDPVNEGLQNEVVNETVLEKTTNNSDAIEHGPVIVESTNEEIIDTVLKESDDVTKQLIEPVTVNLPIEEVIETVIEDTTQHEEASNQIAQPVIIEVPDEDVMLEETTKNSSKNQRKTLGISKKKRKSRRGSYRKKHRNLSTMDDDDSDQAETGNPSSTPQRAEDNIPESSVADNVQSKDSVQCNETPLDLQHVEDPQNVEELRETLDERIEDEVIDLEQIEEPAEINNDDFRDKGEVNGSEVDTIAHQVNSKIIPKSKEKSEFEESIEISDTEDVEDATVSVPNYEDISSSHNDTAEYAEIQEVVSGIVNQLEVEESCISKDNDTTQSEKQQAVSEDISNILNQQDSQENDELSENDKHSLSDEIDSQSEMKQRDNKTDNELVDADIEIETTAISEIDNGNTEEVSQLEVEESQTTNDEVDICTQIEKTTQPIIPEDSADESREKIYKTDSSNVYEVSQNDAEEMIDSEDTKNSKITEEDSLSFGLLSQTEREDFSPIGQASLHLPEDAILQPKKPKKRKHSRHKSSSKKRRRSKETEKPVQKIEQDLHISEVAPTATEQQSSNASLSEEKSTSEILAVEAEEIVQIDKVEQGSDVQVTEETVITEEISLDDGLTTVPHDSIQETVVTEEIVHEIISNIEQHDQEEPSTASVDKVCTVQSDIECVEIIDEEIVLANIEESTENNDNTMNSDIGAEKECDQQVDPDISPITDIKEDAKHSEIDSSVGGISETVEIVNNEATVDKHDEISKLEQETDLHETHSNKEALEEPDIDKAENNSGSGDDSVDPETLKNHTVEIHTLDNTNIEIEKVQEDTMSQNVIEPNITSESITKETEETTQPVIVESHHETIEKLQEISNEGFVEMKDIDMNGEIEGGNIVQEQEGNYDVGETVDLSEYLEAPKDRTHEMIVDQITHESPVATKENDVDNSAELSVQGGEKEIMIDQREKSESDHEPPVIQLEQTVGSDIVLQNDQTTKDASSVDAVVHNNEVEIQCANNENDFLKFSIQTNLSNLSSREELSALALTSLAELKSSFDSDSNTSAESPEKNDIVFSEKISEPELVAIEANLTVVSEKDLADGQVEITAEKVISAKKPSAVSHFSVDFSDSTNDSISTVDTCDASKIIEFDSKGTEFSSNAMTKEMRPKADNKKSNTYERCELLDILEGNSDFDKKADIKSRGKAFTDDICDFEEHIPSQIVCSAKFKQDIDEIKDEMKKKESPTKSSIMSTTTKLMERLTEDKTTDHSTAITAKDSPTDTILVTHQDVIVNTAGQLCKKNSQNTTKLKVKPIIISEQIIRPASSKAGRVTEKPQQTLMDDIEDVEAFVIHKDLKKHIEEKEVLPKVLSPTKPPRKSSRPRGAGKAKILQQTIITPAGEIIQPATSKAKKSTVKPILGKPTILKSPTVDIPSLSPSIASSSVKTQILKTTLTAAVTAAVSLPTMSPVSINTSQDDNEFDINSMPIVLSDEILTPESIENMPIVIGGDTVTKTEAQTKMIVKKTVPPKIITKVTTVTAPPAVTTKTITTPKLSRPRILQTVSKPSKTPTSMPPSTTKSGKYILVPQGSLGMPQQQFMNKKAMAKRSVSSGSPSVAPEPTGNKIMIVTNQQGQQQRLLLTPAQQKMLGYQNPGQKLAKAVVKSNMLPKTILSPKGVPPLEPVVSKIPTMMTHKASASPSLVPITSQPMTSATLTGRGLKTVTKKATTLTQKPQGGKTPKTILITTKHGQTVKKITTTDDDIEKQVAAQLEAIKASAGMKFGTSSKFADPGNKIVHKAPKRSYPKKVEPKQKPVPMLSIPSPASPRTEALGTPPPLVGTSKKPPVPVTQPPPLPEEPAKPERPLNQLVIQDAVGNQTTITEGQILALPNETIGGQPHSYVLVTLDHSGNLTPLNNEALMSLDPNLSLGGDLSNMVLQIDQGTLSSGVEQPLPLAQAATVKLSHPGETLQAGTSKIEIPVNNASVSIPMINTEYQEPPLPQELTIPAAPTNVQTIVPSTNGEPGQQLIVTGDPIATQKFLESLTEGSTDLANIIANAEGKSILIQAGDQQILINANNDSQMMMSEHLEGTKGVSKPNRSTDILAAALADTDVFPPQKTSPSGGGLYPMGVGGVLETSLTLGAPIMTPLEVPSTNAKKVEEDVLAQVPKNVDLPITITDPNISQTVANQQMLVNELGANLDMTLSGVPTAMTSPGFSFSLPSLEENVDHLGHKPFNSSMPLLNDEAEEGGALGRRSARGEEAKSRRHGIPDGSFLEVESRFTLGGEMCSSLSEPPPEMFDISEVNNFMDKRSTPQSTSDPSEGLSKDGDTTDFSTQAESSNEGSCEIPIQKKIVTRDFRFGGSEGSL